MNYECFINAEFTMNSLRTTCFTNASKSDLKVFEGFCSGFICLPAGPRSLGRLISAAVCFYVAKVALAVSSLSPSLGVITGSHSRGAL